MTKRTAVVLSGIVVTSLAGCSLESSSPSHEVSVRAPLVEVTPIRGGAPDGTLVLTFDDGPSPHTLELASFLADAGISATFFVIGTSIEDAGGTTSDGGSSVLQQLIFLGHRIANHTQNHTGISSPTPCPTPVPYIQSEIKLLQQSIDQYQFDDVYPLRPPGQVWNIWNGVANTCSSDSVLASTDSDLRRISGPIHSDIFSGYDVGTDPGTQSMPDYACWSAGWTPAHCATAYLNTILTRQRDGSYSTSRKGPGGIVLIHDRPLTEPSGLSATQMVEALVPMALNAGYHFAPLSVVVDPMATNPSCNQIQSCAATWSNDFAEPAFGLSASYYRTFHLADVNGDGRADACARVDVGIVCGLSSGSSFAANQNWLPSEFTDTQGWLAERYGTTVQFGDLNGDGLSDVCGRSVSGMLCALSNRAKFNPPTLWDPIDQFSNATEFSASAVKYQSIRIGDINNDGKADVCGRRSDGLICALSNGNSFGVATLWSAFFSDVNGWGAPQYGSTTMIAKNADGRALVCLRGAEGVYCAYPNAAQTALGVVNKWSWGSDFSDAAGFGGPPYYSSIRLADINADGLVDLCGRSAEGVICALSNGVRFGKASPWVATAFVDSQGWNADRYGSTLSFGDLNKDGFVDVCARGVVPQCWLARARAK